MKLQFRRFYIKKPNNHKKWCSVKQLGFIGKLLVGVVNSPKQGPYADKADLYYNRGNYTGVYLTGKRESERIIHIQVGDTQVRHYEWRIVERR